MLGTDGRVKEKLLKPGVGRIISFICAKCPLLVTVGNSAEAYSSLDLLFYETWYVQLCFPGGSAEKNPPAKAGDVGLIPGSGRPLEKGKATHSVFLPGKSHEQRSLAV